MFRESKRLDDIDFLIDWQEFLRRYLNSYLEYVEQVCSSTMLPTPIHIICGSIQHGTQVWVLPTWIHQTTRSIDPNVDMVWWYSHAAPALLPIGLSGKRGWTTYALATRHVWMCYVSTTADGDDEADTRRRLGITYGVLLSEPSVVHISKRRKWDSVGFPCTRDEPWASSWQSRTWVMTWYLRAITNGDFRTKATWCGPCANDDTCMSTWQKPKLMTDTFPIEDARALTENWLVRGQPPSCI